MLMNIFKVKLLTTAINIICILSLALIIKENTEQYVIIASMYAAYMCGVYSHILTGFVKKYIVGYNDLDLYLLDMAKSAKKCFDFAANPNTKQPSDSDYTKLYVFTNFCAKKNYIIFITLFRSVA